MISVVIEGNAKYCERLGVELIPSINVLSHQNCTQKVKVHNSSSIPKTVAKGVLHPFYDDITIKSKGFKQHLQHLVDP